MDPRALETRSRSAQAVLSVSKGRFRGAVNYAQANIAAPVTALILILFTWHLALSVLGVPSFIIPKPFDIVSAAIENRALLLESTWRTVSAALSGLIVAILIGIAVAVLFRQAQWLERSLMPYAVLLQTTPIVAVAPIVVIWIGPGLYAIVVVVFIISFFPMMSNTLAGFHSVDPERADLFRLYHASRLRALWKLEFPSALPFIVAGARISAGLSVIGAIVGEFVAGIGGGRGGLGYVVTVSARQLNTPYLFAAAIAGALVGIIFYNVVGISARHLLGAWQDSYARGTELRPSG
jgi:NitT/TauT family transport system permease protein